MKFDNRLITFNKPDLEKHLCLPKVFTPKLAEEIGLHIGDGSMNYYGLKSKGFYQLRGHITDDKPHYYSRIRKIYKDLFNLDINLREMQSTGVVGFQIWSDALVQFKHKSLGLILGKKKEISIPSTILKSQELSMAFLRGFFDTDGCLYMYRLYGKLYPRIEMATISGHLMQQISDILTNLNYRHGLYVQKRAKYGWNDLHTIHIRGVNLTKRWFEEIQPQNPKHQAKYEKLIKENWAR